MGAELPGDFVEEPDECRVAIGLDVVHGVDQAVAEEACPGAVHGRPGEVRVIGRGDPIGQDLASAGAGRQAGAEWSRWAALTTFVVPGMVSSRRCGVFASRAEGVGVIRLLGDAGEEGGEAPEFLPLPLRERMVVALGALHADAEEGPRRIARDDLRLPAPGRVEGGGRWLDRRRGHHFVRAAAEPGREDLADDLVVARVLVDLLPQPGLQAARRRPRPDRRPRGAGAVATAGRSAPRKPGCPASGRRGPLACRGPGRSRKSRASPAVGIFPTRSRLARRRNSPSSATAAGRIFASAHRAARRASIARARVRAARSTEVSPAAVGPQ